LRWFFDTPLPKTFTWNLQGEKRFPRVKMEHWDLIPKPENIHYLWDFKILGENLCFYCPPEVAMREQVPPCAWLVANWLPCFVFPITQTSHRAIFVGIFALNSTAQIRFLSYYSWYNPSISSHIQITSSFRVLLLHAPLVQPSFVFIPHNRVDT
jgi:hypothetical protein